MRCCAARMLPAILTPGEVRRILPAMNSYTKVSDKGQVVVPKAARERLRWGAGTELEVIESSDAITLRPRRTGGTISVAQAVARLRRIYRHEGASIPVEKLGWAPDADDRET